MGVSPSFYRVPYYTWPSTASGDGIRARLHIKWLFSPCQNLASSTLSAGLCRFLGYATHCSEELDVQSKLASRTFRVIRNVF